MAGSPVAFCYPFPRTLFRVRKKRLHKNQYTLKILASSSEDGKTRLWDLTSFKCLRVLYEHEGPVFDVAFYPDSQQLITGIGDGTVKLWDEESDHSIKMFRMPRLYERTNITNVTGLTPAQKKSLFVLGAIDDVTIDLDV